MKELEPIEKKSLYRYNYGSVGVSIVVNSTVSEIPKIYIFLLLYFTSVLVLII